MHTHEQLKIIVSEHYGLSRDVTDEELNAEISNLWRKHKKGTLDDSAEYLFYRLGLDKAQETII